MSLSVPIEDLCRLQVSARISPKGHPVIYLSLKPDAHSQERLASSPASPTGIHVNIQRAVAEDGSEFALHLTTSFPELEHISTASSKMDVTSELECESRKEAYFMGSAPPVTLPPEQTTVTLPAHISGSPSSSDPWLQATSQNNQSLVDGGSNTSNESSGSPSGIPLLSEHGYTPESAVDLTSLAGDYDSYDAEVREQERNASSDMNMFPDVTQFLPPCPPLSAPIPGIHDFTASLTTDDIEALLSMSTFTLNHEVSPNEEPNHAESSLHSTPLEDVRHTTVSDVPPPDHSNKSFSDHSRKQRLPCLEPNCTRRFMSEYTRRVHMQTHMPRRTFVCTQGCTEEFSRQHDRFRHEVVKHGRKSEWSCETCLGFFSSEKSLANHKCTNAARKRWKSGANSTG